MIPSDRIGMSQAAIKAAILGELEQSGLGEERNAIATAVAEVMDANNHEILRQLRELIRPIAAAAAAQEPDAVDEELP